MIGEAADVTAVVVSYQAGPGLVESLRTLVEQSSFAAVHLVDSGSTDGSPKCVREQVPGVQVTELGENLGPCATRNMGLRLAKTPFVLLLDADTRLDPAAVPLLREALLQDAERVAAGPSIRFGDRPDVVQYEGGVAHYAGLPHLLLHGQPAVPGPTREVDVVTSGCVLLRREPALAAGGFDETYFFLMEDVDFSLRLRILGHRLVVVPDAHCWNQGSSEGLSLHEDAYPSRRFRLHARNRWILVFGLWEWTTLLALWPALLLFECAWFAFAVLAGHPMAFLAGKLEVIGLVPRIWRKRRSLAGRRRVRDRELLGSPPLTFTSQALAQPLARRCASVLDIMMRFYHTIGRGFSR